MFPNEVNRVAGVEAGRERFPVWESDPFDFEAVSPTVESRSSVNRCTEDLASVQGLTVSGFRRSGVWITIVRRRAIYWRISIVIAWTTTFELVRSMVWVKTIDTTRSCDGRNVE